MSCVAAMLLALLFASCRHGLEFTDEGFYWASIAYPRALSASATQFGFAYHPLYLALDGNLVLVRQANLLLTVLLGFSLAFS